MTQHTIAKLVNFVEHPNDVRFKDLSGQKFGDLIALGYVGKFPNSTRISAWFCLCSCGRYKVIRSSVLLNGATKSCGCKQTEKFEQMVVKHGRSRTTAYSAYHHVINRCRRDTSYISKGITCELTFEEFYAIVGDPPDDYRTSIDRIDNSKGYVKGNIKWASIQEQARNKTNNRNFTVGGETMCLAAWAEKTGVKVSLIRDRIDRLGWCPECAITLGLGSRCKHLPPVTKSRVITLTVNGMTKPLTEWAIDSLVDVGTVRARYDKGWCHECCIKTVREGKHERCTHR